MLLGQNSRWPPGNHTVPLNVAVAALWHALMPFDQVLANHNIDPSAWGEDLSPRRPCPASVTRTSSLQPSAARQWPKYRGRGRRRTHPRPRSGFGEPQPSGDRVNALSAVSAQRQDRPQAPRPYDDGTAPRGPSVPPGPFCNPFATADFF